MRRGSAGTRNYEDASSSDGRNQLEGGYRKEREGREAPFEHYVLSCNRELSSAQSFCFRRLHSVRDFESRTGSIVSEKFEDV